MKILIVEDEILLAKQLQKMLQGIEPSATIVGLTHSVEKTVEWLQSNETPDLILMDIELGDGQSFQVFDRLQVKTPVIFTTAYDEYALKAFKVNSIDYLLKPVDPEELRTAIEKFKERLAAPLTNDNIIRLLADLNLQQQTGKFRERILVKQGQKMISLELSQVAYFFSEGGFSYIRTNNNQKFITDYTMDELEQSVSPNQFFRANRQYLLASHCIDSIHPWFNQKLKVDVKPNTEEPVIISREKAQAFKKWMGA
ncbi:LytTR family DNA-binding domain-containing protein [Flavihumibacter rivuli]|uniref:LytR/AlgR family response regulator transcription factor n=1 Tax=Flavihumibacter rivuli TaxID=2838156 RepID=UPI001BDE774E|nr:LytTR family DNA-binding domain-containing protein [Flavihumibacter rivuli]ULQ56331.1 LytTR family DNA-binding domain-containing protein [Flavihumibacter rivuli]